MNSKTSSRGRRSRPDGDRQHGPADCMRPAGASGARATTASGRSLTCMRSRRDRLALSTSRQRAQAELAHGRWLDSSCSSSPASGMRWQLERCGRGRVRTRGLHAQDAWRGLVHRSDFVRRRVSLPPPENPSSGPQIASDRRNGSRVVPGEAGSHRYHPHDAAAEGPWTASAPARSPARAASGARSCGYRGRAARARRGARLSRTAAARTSAAPRSSASSRWPSRRTQDAGDAGLARRGARGARRAGRLPRVRGRRPACGWSRSATDWTRMGRSWRRDIRFDDPTVSRRHAMVAPRGRRRAGARRPQPERRVRERRAGRMAARSTDGDEVTIGRFRPVLPQPLAAATGRRGLGPTRRPRLT